MRVRLLTVVLLLGGCWNWSFPEDLLGQDSRPTEAAVDVKSDVARDLEPTDGPKADLIPDAKMDQLLDGPPTCTPACVPTSTKPICEGWTCRACQTNGECQGISTGELCAADGSCPAEQSIAYVDKSAGTCSSSGGSKGAPYCQIDEALGKGKKLILVRPGSYADDLVLTGVNHEIYGELGAVISLSGCEKLLIKGSSDVVLQGFEIKSNVSQEDLSKAMINVSEMAKVRLVQNVLGPSGCIGISASKDTKVTLQRNLVVKNPGGGLVLAGTYTVENNIIVQNSKASVNFGGAKLTPLSVTTATFINNTVADNICKGSNVEEACGVRCDVDKVKLVNSIFWGNTFNSNKDPTKDRQYSDKCTPSYCFEELKGGSPFPTNITAPTSGFVGPTPSTSADAYHIKPTSAARDKGTKTGAPPVDYDGQTRDPNPDIGADELDIP